jgi:hypothetical protein
MEWSRSSDKEQVVRGSAPDTPIPYVSRILGDGDKLVQLGHINTEIIWVFTSLQKKQQLL